jgi:predicted nucleotidyltransferase
MTQHSNNRIEKTITKMLNRLVDNYHPIKVILFGSYAVGNPTDDSDIDLLIIKDTQERFIDRWSTVGNILAGTHPSIPVDTLVLTPQELEKRLSIGDQFIEEILKTGKLLYAS